MLATLPRLVTRVSVRASIRPQRAAQKVMAFKAGDEREKTDVAKPAAESKAKAPVKHIPHEQTQIQHPMR